MVSSIGGMGGGVILHLADRREVQNVSGELCFLPAAGFHGHELLVLLKMFLENCLILLFKILTTFF